METKALIFGCAGPVLSDEEIGFFKENPPWGFILFARNIEDRDQVLRLTDQMRECAGRQNVPILIDQEGGRVKRLRPPHWYNYPPGRALGEVFEHNSTAGRRVAWVHARLIAHDLGEIGINVNCLPILDVPVEGVHDAIGDRAYSQNTEIVTEIGRAVIDGLMAGGVLPVIKHMPGHGRAVCDSHLELPRVDACEEELIEADFLPFRQLSGVGMGMTAHIVFEAIDPGLPATTSKKMIDEVIRGKIGFDGLLMSDDVSMNALSGDYRQRAQSIFGAGVDIVLHCNGEMEQMIEVAAETPLLTGKALERAEKALSELRSAEPVDPESLRAELEELIPPID